MRNARRVVGAHSVIAEVRRKIAGSINRAWRERTEHKDGPASPHPIVAKDQPQMKIVSARRAPKRSTIHPLTM